MPPRRVLFIGLGVGALPKFFVKYYPQTQVDVVEICPAVVSVCQIHFKLPPQNDHFQIHIGCGAEYIEKTDRQYDLVFVDGFDEDARVGPLDSFAFYSTAAGVLSENGVLVTNILSHEVDPQLAVERLQQAFDSRSLALTPCKSGNVIAMGWNQGLDPRASSAELQANREALLALSGVNLASTANKLQVVLA